MYVWFKKEAIMELKLFQKYYVEYDNQSDFQGWYFIWLKTKYFQFR